MTKTVPPDDDPRFTRWLQEVGPPPPLPPEDQVPLVRPIIAGIAMATAIAGMGGAAFLAWGLAFQAFSPWVAVPAFVGVIAATSACLVYLLGRAS